MRILTILLIIILSACGSREEPKGAAFEAEGVAIGGYDPVAYFEQSEAKEGDAGTTSEYGGLTYQFASAENKNLFDENPEKYIPAYGGWCAYAVAESSTKMEPDPTMWQVQDGKLLLFYDDWMTSLTGSLKEEWNTDKDGYLIKAENNWEILVSE
ncbi:MAG: YHS domain-containing (seleno)protein [Cyclobacteriaceae bacterium]